MFSFGTLGGDAMIIARILYCDHVVRFGTCRLMFLLVLDYTLLFRAEISG